MILTIFEKTNADVIQLFLTICKNYKLFIIFCELYPKIKNRYDNILNDMITCHIADGKIENLIDDEYIDVFDKPYIIIMDVPQRDIPPYHMWSHNKRKNNLPYFVSMSQSGICREWILHEDCPDDYPDCIKGHVHQYYVNDVKVRQISIGDHIYKSFKYIN